MERCVRVCRAEVFFFFFVFAFRSLLLSDERFAFSDDLTMSGCVRLFMQVHPCMVQQQLITVWQWVYWWKAEAIYTERSELRGFQSRRHAARKCVCGSL